MSVGDCEGVASVALNVRDRMEFSVEVSLKATDQAYQRAVSAEKPHKSGCLLILKLLCGARLGRFDMLKAITHLATFVNQWCKACDRMLHRLMSRRR